MTIRLNRFTSFILCILIAGIALALAPRHHWLLWPFALFALLVLVGIRDLIQPQHSIQRNYPVIGHIRWFVEMIRPELRQYLFEADEEAAPFSRSQRSLVYQRAKGQAGDHPFGTLLDVYRDGYEFIGHSTRPIPAADPASFRIMIGGDQCKQPYSASVFNISAMSFGSLSANAIRALNKGAKMGGFSHDTGEGSISPYHREFGGDIVWEIASGYFGCRDAEGRFDPERFAAQAKSDQVKMIEIKMSQGAKPGHGGILPAAKVTAEISETRGVPMGKDCISPPTHSAFSTPLEMMAFIAQLRELSGGKPVGFKLCLGHPWEFMGIVKAMLATGTYPDFIVVDGAEGGTGAAPVEFSDHIGVPMREGLLFVHNVLTGGGDPRSDQGRRRRPDRQRLRHRQRAGDRFRLGERRARLHVRGRLHTVAVVQHQSLPDRRRHPGPGPPARAGGARQGRAGEEFPRQHPACTVRYARGRGRRASLRPRAASSGAPGELDRGAAILRAARLPRTQCADRGADREWFLQAQLGSGAGGQFLMVSK
jgi:glutamate synthase domain-containing protein 2